MEHLGEAFGQLDLSLFVSYHDLELMVACKRVGIDFNCVLCRSTYDREQISFDIVIIESLGRF